MPREDNKYPPGINEKRFPNARLKLDPTWVHRASKAAVILALHKNAAEDRSCAQGAEHRYPTEVEKGPGTLTATGGVVKLGRLRQRVDQGGRHGVYKHVQMIKLKYVGRQ